jgi:hypothetical protein
MKAVKLDVAPLRSSRSEEPMAVKRRASNPPTIQRLDGGS